MRTTQGSRIDLRAATKENRIHLSAFLDRVQKEKMKRHCMSLLLTLCEMMIRLFCIRCHILAIQRSIIILSFLAFSFFMIGCGDKFDPVQEFDFDPNESNELVTYVDDIQPLLETHCLLCHSADNQGVDRNGAPIGINFDTYEDIIIWVNETSLRIQSGTMPPTGGIPQDERILFQRWIDDGLLFE